MLSEELNGKRLELLKDASPTITRVGVFSNPANPTQPLEWKAIKPRQWRWDSNFNR